MEKELIILCDWPLFLYAWSNHRMSCSHSHNIYLMDAFAAKSMLKHERERTFQWAIFKYSLLYTLYTQSYICDACFFFSSTSCQLWLCYWTSGQAARYLSNTTNSNVEWLMKIDLLTNDRHTKHSLTCVSSRRFIATSFDKLRSRCIFGGLSSLAGTNWPI